MPGTQQELQNLLSALRKRKGVSIKIQSRSDKEEDPELRLMWGDYWVKEELSKEFTELGFTVTESDPDVFIHFFGGPPKKKPPRDSYNIVWLYSHPDDADPETLSLFDKVFCASGQFIHRLKEMGCRNVEYRPACTSKKPLDIPKKYDVVFLGNARASREDGRSIIGDLGKTPHNLKVWGNLWEKHLPPENIGGRYWDYRELEKLYASARITLNDHNHDMRREGFVSNKVFDILASGGFVISDKNPGLDGLFGDSVPQYETPEELRSLVDHYLENPEERNALAEKGRREALKRTYKECARQIIKDVLPNDKTGPQTPKNP